MDYQGKCLFCGGDVYLDLDTGIEECQHCGYKENTGRTREVIKKELEEIEKNI